MNKLYFDFIPCSFVLISIKIWTFLSFFFKFEIASRENWVKYVLVWSDMLLYNLWMSLNTSYLLPHVLKSQILGVMTPSENLSDWMTSRLRFITPVVIMTERKGKVGGESESHGGRQEAGLGRTGFTGAGLWGWRWPPQPRLSGQTQTGPGTKKRDTFES